ncbi:MULTISPECIES: ABC transporter ATP-binding protein [Caproicibacterium]|uniref:ABC transporter ATP-binding protein n=1 Tax=Caproicibacterium argilliputei TaxID=3030016 RepID=A0AA97DBU1_9FIRM|nr:ABC transporter ATP-binding protein [Caproicibacterium argilliputei]WOC33387.1 ABC transporter ATP-binding protein [Caproicibacterium argilliputei]
MDAIFTERLTKSFDGRANALDTLSITVPEGAAFALLGGNGAGKTTAVKLLAGLLTPTSGYSEILGVNPMKKSARLHKVCGVVTPSARMYACMTGQENLAFFGEAAGMKNTDAQTRTAELMKELGIWQARDLPVSEFPTGMLQRLSLARALMTHPRVLLLDEPTVGLDTEGAEAMVGVISGLVKKEGVTVFLCTHHFLYAQQLCTEYGILSKGSLIAGGTLEVLCRKAGCRIRAGFRLPPQDALGGFTQGADDFWEKEIEQEEEMPELLRRAVAEGHDIYEARLCRPTLADAYMALLGKERSL